MSTLYIVSTPIGNLEDISIRALKTLFTVDVLACEDTRNTGQLLTLLVEKFAQTIQVVKMKKPVLISFYDEVEESKSFEIIEMLKSGKDVALVSDAGTPLIADPGFRLVRACIKEGIKIESIPGASSVITALTLSGLPTHAFSFLGFLPQKKLKRKELFTNIQLTSQLPKHVYINTFIAFESPHRIQETLEDMKAVFGDIEVVIARELTKMHEEILRGKISEIQTKADTLKGELVLLFAL